MVVICLSSTLYIVVCISKSSKKGDRPIDFQTQQDGVQKVAKETLNCKNGRLPFPNFYDSVILGV
jgi:hypothetical protein